MPWLAIVVSCLYVCIFTSGIMWLSATRALGKPISWRVRSHCDFCQHQLTWWQLIPIIGWIIQLGRCHFCGHLISPRYVIIESLMLFWTVLQIPQLTLSSFIWQTIFLLRFLSLAECDHYTKHVSTIELLFLLLIGLIIHVPHSELLSILILTYIGIQLLLRRYPVLGSADVDIMYIIILVWGWQLLTGVILIACISALMNRYLTSQPSVHQPLIPHLWVGLILYRLIDVLI